MTIHAAADDVVAHPLMWPDDQRVAAVAFLFPGGHQNILIPNCAGLTPKLTSHEISFFKFHRWALRL